LIIGLTLLLASGEKQDISKMLEVLTPDQEGA